MGLVVAQGEVRVCVSMCISCFCLQRKFFVSMALKKVSPLSLYLSSLPPPSPPLFPSLLSPFAMYMYM